jgi:hypothetical protein
MTRSVDSLKRVRRIVLTDYVGGVKMLDLERSAGSEDGPGGAGSGHPVGAEAEAHAG